MRRRWRGGPTRPLLRRLVVVEGEGELQAADRDVAGREAAARRPKEKRSDLERRMGDAKDLAARLELLWGTATSELSKPRADDGVRALLDASPGFEEDDAARRRARVLGRRAALAEGAQDLGESSSGREGLRFDRVDRRADAADA